MKLLVTGACGQLGSDLIVELAGRGLQTIATGRAACPALSAAVPYVPLDLTKREAVLQTIDAVRPDAVMHCAAWTAVDAAEKEENREQVFAVNAGGTRSLALACRNTGCRLLYLSTDYVFDGHGGAPWQPDCEEYAPLNVYGQSKLAGELAVRDLLERFFIVRISWAFGKNGGNFVKTMLQLGKNRDRVRVVSDQIGTPTYTPDLAKLLADMIQTERYGTYHVTNEGGYISRYNFTKELYRQAGLQTEVLPVRTAEYGPRGAKRPLNSRLDPSKLTACGFERLPSWQDALDRYLRGTGELENGQNQGDDL